MVEPHKSTGVPCRVKAPPKSGSGGNAMSDLQVEFTDEEPDVEVYSVKYDQDDKQIAASYSDG